MCCPKAGAGGWAAWESARLEDAAGERSMAGAAVPWILLPGAALLKLLAASLSLSLQKENGHSSLPALCSQSCWQGEAAFLLMVLVLPKKSCGRFTGELGDGVGDAS